MTSNIAPSSLSILSEEKLSELSSATAALNKEQLIWASGYLAGLAASPSLSLNEPLIDNKIQRQVSSLTILFGSQTGNAKGVAEKYKEKFVTLGVSAKAVSMSDYKPRLLKNETHLLVVVSTHGEGDPPDDAVELHEFIASKKAPDLSHLQYAVIGLGDTSYEHFCQTAKDFDEKLAARGARSFAKRLDCDVDYGPVVDSWFDSNNPILTDLLRPAQTMPTHKNVQSDSFSNVQKYTKQEPFEASLLQSLKITGRDSVKDIRHIEISLEGSNIKYIPGDTLGVFFTNDDSIIARISKATKTDINASVTINGKAFTLMEALREKCELTLSYPGFVKQYQSYSGDERLAELLSNKSELRAFLAEAQIVDIVERYPYQITPQQLVDALRPITPRLYSIASSQQEVEDEVHLTVAHVRYEAFGFEHQGGASGFLASRIEEGDLLRIFVQDNHHFRLPEHSETPVIMIGPGTGVAPFRAFMQEREAKDAAGKNWLFFGNPTFTQDFLYQTEWQRYLKSGLLTKLSLAFSRDQEEKIYVQDRIREHGKELFKWLEEGAHVYVCGDATQMAKDVEATLLEIIKTQGSKTDAEAKSYLSQMRKAKRYQKDVY